jgi:hypothetical protein
MCIQRGARPFYPPFSGRGSLLWGPGLSSQHPTTSGKPGSPLFVLSIGPHLAASLRTVFWSFLIRYPFALRTVPYSTGLAQRSVSKAGAAFVVLLGCRPEPLRVRRDRLSRGPRPNPPLYCTQPLSFCPQVQPSRYEALRIVEARQVRQLSDARYYRWQKSGTL